MIAEALRPGGAGCGVEEYREGMIRDAAQAWHWSPHSCKQLTDSWLKKCRPRSNKTGFRANKENKRIVCNICKRHHVWNIWRYSGPAD